MKLVVAVDKRWAIGNKGQLLVRIPEDLQNFRELTEGNVVVLGRKTLETFPAGKPLANRKNIILTSKGLETNIDAIECRNVEELLLTLEDYNTEDVFVIGGESVYKELLPFVDTAYVTYIDYKYEADAFFENLDENEDWIKTEESEERTYFDVEYYFRKYERKKHK